MIELKPTTKQLYNQLELADWFAAVGSPADLDVVVVSSWDEAIASSSSTHWENTQIDASNRTTRELSANHRERFRLWNDIVSAVKVQFEPLIEKKLDIAVKVHRCKPEAIMADVQWSIVSAAVESEYADIVSFDFYSSLARFYTAGRYPCGWSGSWPAGQLVIF